jgi:outer membrane protein OmpA-like peptidoglycan-associated protein
MAEDLLNRNRYDTEEAKRLADQAAYQAAHAVFLNNTIRRLKEEDADFEALLLYAEDQIERIAAATALPADFQNGIEPVVTSIVNAIGADKDAIEELKSVKTRLENRLAATKAELTETIDRLRAENTRLKNNLRAEKKATEDAKAETAALEARLQSKSDRWSAELESEKTRMKAAFDTETEAMKNKFQKQIAALKTEYEKKIEDISQAAAEQTRQVRAESKAATSDTISRIKNAHKEALSALKAKTAETLAERNREIADLQARVLELENRLAKETTEAKAMRQQLEKRRLRREKVSEISAALTDDEGRVLTDAEGNVILRLYGLSFKSGQSSIETSFYPLLSKVIDAIKRFPNSQIVVEGHTDSIGADSVNRTLSNKRAEAVRDYLLANTDISADRISAVGFGKSKPVASNDTPAGRAKNRRIDIVIGPTD